MQKRRFGTITSRANGRHYVQATVPDTSGGTKRVSLGGFGTRREAEHALARAAVELERGRLAVPSRRTLVGFLTEEWLPAIAGDVRPTTLANYTVLVRAYVGRSLIAHRRLTDLSELELKRLYNELREAGGRDGRPLSAKTVLHVHTMLRRALADAVASKLISRNPAPRRRPRVERSEGAWLSEAELAEMLAAARAVAPDLYPALRLAALAGLRRGEIAGLRWSDVDLARSTVTVRRTRVMAGGRVVGRRANGRGRGTARGRA